MSRAVIAVSRLAPLARAWRSNGGVGIMPSTQMTPASAGLSASILTTLRRHLHHPARKTSRRPLGFSLSDFIPAKVRLEFFWNLHRAVRLLKSLNQRREQSRQRQSGAVERVTEFVFSVRTASPARTFVAKIHPARLKIFVIGAARNLQIRAAVAGTGRP